MEIVGHHGTTEEIADRMLMSRKIKLSDENCTAGKGFYLWEDTVFSRELAKCWAMQKYCSNTKFLSKNTKILEVSFKIDENDYLDFNEIEHLRSFLELSQKNPKLSKSQVIRAYIESLENKSVVIKCFRSRVSPPNNAWKIIGYDIKRLDVPCAYVIRYPNELDMIKKNVIVPDERKFEEAG